MGWCELLKRKPGVILSGLCLILTMLTPITDGIAVMSIDLGSEWIKVAIVKPGVPMEIAMNKESKRKTPSVVALNGDERTFSDPAMSVAVRKPSNAYIYLTHIIGKSYDSTAAQLYKKRSRKGTETTINGLMLRFPQHTLLKDEKRDTVLFENSSGQKYSPEELLGMILNNSRHIGEDFADHPMKDAVITVPVYFNQAERKAILNAAKLVGLNVLQLQNDNAAVALHYGIFRMASFNATEKHIMFFDMGATSTVVTIVGYSTVRVKDRGYAETVPQLVVKGVGFDTTLGGLEMDLQLREHLLQLFKKQGKAKGDIEKNPRAMAKLLKEAKRLKQVLSANAFHFAQIENLFEEQDFRAKVTRAEFEELCQDLFARVSNPVNAALKSAAIPLDNIETVILMGGSTRVPKVQEILMQTVKKSELGKSINTDEAAALGAVYKATEMTKGFKVKRFLVKDVNLFPIDVSFTRPSTNDQGEPYTRVVTRTLFHHLNPLPQKKVMTFNKKPDDFSFNVSYGEATFLEHGKGTLDLGKLSEVSLKGVGDSYTKNKGLTPKGVKAYFNLDESGILHLEKVESHFETVVGQEPKEEEQSTFAKIGSTLSSLFGSGTEEKDKKVDGKAEEKYEEAKGEDDKKRDGSKTDTKEEEEKPKEDSKKEEKKADDKVNEKKASEKGQDTVANKTANATESKNATASDGNATAKEKPPPKPVLLKEEITASWINNDVPELSGDAFDASTKLLADFQKRDEDKRATEKARNTLESFIFEFREKMNSDEYGSLSSQSEKDTISESLAKVSEWLDDDGWTAKTDEFKAKLKELKSLTQDLRSRMSEFELRPKAIAELLNSLNLSSVFLKQVEAMPLADEIYSEKDLKDLGKVYNETLEWLTVNWKRQNASDPKQKPVMLVKDIVNTQGKIDRELMYLINKAKYYVPKPKPKVNQTLKNTTTANATKTDKAANTTKTDKTSNGTESDKTAKPKDTPKESESKKEDDIKTDAAGKDDKKDKTKDADKEKGKEEQKTKEESETLQLDSKASVEKPSDTPIADKSDKKEDKASSEKKEEGNKPESRHEGKVPDEL